MKNPLHIETSKKTTPPWPLWKVGLVASVASAAVNVALGLLTMPYLGVPETFMPITPVPVIFWSFVGAWGAVAVFAIIQRSASLPYRAFNIVAAIVLILSFIPDFLLTQVRTGPLAGATNAAILVLMSMHVISAAIVIRLILRHTRA